MGKSNLSVSSTLLVGVFLAVGSVAQAQQINIIGGVNVTAVDPIASSTVALLVGNALCTGSLLANDLVVTAAHCTFDEQGKPLNPADMSVVFAQKVDTSGKSHGEKVLGYFANPGYDGLGKGNDQHDIAVIRFAGPIPAGFAVANILPSASMLSVGEPVTLAGFGISDAFAQTGAGTLRKVDVKIKSVTFAKTEVLLDQTGGHGACHGDSGGPAFVKAGNTYQLWGVTNRGYPDTAPDDCAHFAVYTSINAYNSWILEVANQLHAAGGGSVNRNAPRAGHGQGRGHGPIWGN